MAGGWHTSSPSVAASKIDPAALAALQSIANALLNVSPIEDFTGECVVTVDCADAVSSDEFDGQCLLVIECEESVIAGRLNGKCVVTVDCDSTFIENGLLSESGEAVVDESDNYVIYN